MYAMVCVCVCMCVSQRDFSFGAIVRIFGITWATIKKRRICHLGNLENICKSVSNSIAMSAVLLTYIHTYYICLNLFYNKSSV